LATSWSSSREANPSHRLTSTGSYRSDFWPGVGEAPQRVLTFTRCRYHPVLFKRGQQHPWVPAEPHAVDATDLAWVQQNTAVPTLSFFTDLAALLVSEATSPRKAFTGHLLSTHFSFLQPRAMPPPTPTGTWRARSRHADAESCRVKAQYTNWWSTWQGWGRSPTDHQARASRPACSSPCCPELTGSKKTSGCRTSVSPNKVQFQLLHTKNGGFLTSVPTVKPHS